MRTILFSILLSFSIVGSAQSIIILGTTQDGGFPHIGCMEECQLAYKYPGMKRYVASIAITDKESGKWWLIDATPDLDDQLKLFQDLTEGKYPYLPEGIFLTHAHIGHYSGLMLLGREALGVKKVKVYSLPRMKTFLETNGPWSQLVELGNIQLEEINADVPIKVSEEIAILPFLVPHRDEFSETAGYRIDFKESSALYIPDIDKWNKWDRDIVKLVKQVDHAFLDASFYEEGELPNRAMSEIPHPFVTETMALFNDEPNEVRSKIKFIHFNHTNPVLFLDNARQKAKEKGFNMAEQGDIY